MRKQDRQGARTPADVERRFRNVPSVATDAQKRATKAEQEVENLKVQKITVDRLDIDGQELNIKVAATNITGQITAEQINAKGLEVEAANITGTLKAEQIEGIELSVDIADIKEKLTTDKLTADQIDATNLKVEAANITGTLEAEQIDATNLKVDAANIEGTLTAEQIDATNLKVKAANIEEKLTAEQINTDDMVVQKALIGAWHLQKTVIDVSPSELITEYALYSDEIYDTDRGVTYRVHLTPKGVYVDGRDETGASYFANKSWLEICGG